MPGVYLEKQIGNLLIQTEYYNASHNAERDAQAVLSVIQTANINAFQRDRFLQTNEDQSNDNLTTDDIRTSVKYNVRIWYIIKVLRYLLSPVSAALANANLVIQLSFNR